MPAPWIPGLISSPQNSEKNNYLQQLQQQQEQQEEQDMLQQLPLDDGEILPSLPAIASSQESLQVGANTLLFMSNAADEMNFSGVSASQRPTPSIDFDTAMSSNYGANGSYQLNNMQEESIGNCNRGFGGQSSPWRPRDMWLPNAAAAAASSITDDYCLDRYEVNKRDTSTTTSSRIMSMDRPSHWGSKPKCSKRADTRAQQLLKEKNKKSKIENSPRANNLQNNSSSGHTKAGMIAQFPLSKISTDAGKLNTTSFKPVWMKSTKPSIAFHSSGISSAGAAGSNGDGDHIAEILNEDKIVDILESDINFTGLPVSRDRSATVNTFSSPLVSRTLSLSNEVHRDRQRDTYGDINMDNRDHRGLERQQTGLSTGQIERQTSEWRSPGNLKSSKNGKKGRAKAGSLQAIYQKLTRNIEEKECRMLNIVESMNDALDPRNRALSTLDVCVINMIEVWPFKIVKCCVRALEARVPKGLRRMESVKTQYQHQHQHQHQQSHHTMQDSIIGVVEDGAEGGVNVSHVSGPDYQQTDSIIGQNVEFAKEANQSSVAGGFDDTDFMNTLGPSHLHNDSQFTSRDNYASSLTNDHQSTSLELPEVSAPSTMHYTDYNGRSLSRKESSIEIMNGKNIDENHPFYKLLCIGTYVLVYFRADRFKETLNSISGAVIRIYDPEILSEHNTKNIQSDRMHTDTTSNADGRESTEGLNVDDNNGVSYDMIESHNIHDDDNQNTGHNNLGYTLHNRNDNHNHDYSLHQSIAHTPGMMNLSMGTVSRPEGTEERHVDRFSRNTSAEFHHPEGHLERPLLKIICTRLYDIRT